MFKSFLQFSLFCQDFDLAKFISKRWFIQQQIPGWRGGGSGHHVSQVFSKGQNILRLIDLYSFQVGSYYTNLNVGGLPTTSHKWIFTKTTRNDRKSALLRMAVNYLPASQNRCVPWLQIWCCFCRGSNVWTVLFRYWGRQIISFFKTEVVTTSVPQDSQREKQDKKGANKKTEEHLWSLTT